MSGSPARSMAEPTTWAEPGGVRSTTSWPRGRRPPATRRAPDADGPRAPPAPRQLGDRVRRLAAAHAHLDGAEVVEVARDGGLGGDDALGREQVDQLGLARHRLRSSSCGDAVLALVLRQPHRGGSVGRRPATRTGRAPRACGCAPAATPRLRGPSTTSASTSSPRWAGRQCRKTASPPAASISAVVDPEALEGAAAFVGLGLLPHRHPDVGVDGVGAVDRRVRGGRHLEGRRRARRCGRRPRRSGRIRAGRRPRT